MREGVREGERESFAPLGACSFICARSVLGHGGFDSNNESNLRVVEIARIYL